MVGGIYKKTKEKKKRIMFDEVDDLMEKGSCCFPCLSFRFLVWMMQDGRRKTDDGREDGLNRGEGSGMKEVAIERRRQ
jgi:hypothetical protein